MTSSDLSIFQDIPQKSDPLGRSQSDMEENFDYQQIILNKDHQIVFNHSANATPGLGTLGEGRHRQVSFLNQSDTFPSDPLNPPFNNLDNVNSMVFDAQIERETPNADLFFKNSTFGPVQLTQGNEAYANAFATITTISSTNSGAVTSLPGGLLLQYGFARTTSRDIQPKDNTQFKFPVPFGGPPYSVVLTVNESDGSLGPLTLLALTSSTTFGVKTPIGTSPVHFFYMAIGPQGTE